MFSNEIYSSTIFRIRVNVLSVVTKSVAWFSVEVSQKKKLV